jgi:DNA-binding NtrC family response regulator
MKQKILVLDDEASMLEFLSIMLEKEGYEVKTSQNGQKALTLAKNSFFDVIITDLKMPKMSGIEFLKKVKVFSPHSVFIVITAHSSLDTAVEAMRLGAYDYISKPFKIAEIRFAVRRALERKKLIEENFYLKKRVQSKDEYNIVGSSIKIKKVLAMIEQVAKSNSTILIYGESGTGKELAARAVYKNSLRKDAPFLAIDCSALPETLLEAELFGYVKGAFTGADKDKAGLFSVTNGGTIFLDEIGEISSSIQMKFLRVLQEKEFKPLGSTQVSKVDVRLIAATRKDLKEEISKGNFREDLYYRISVIPLYLPPLRERSEDIELLSEYFLKKYIIENNKRHIKSIDKDVFEVMKKYPWPGNIRELENAIERAVILCEKDKITLSDLPETLHIASAGREDEFSFDWKNKDLRAAKEDFEKIFIINMLKKSRGNITLASKYSGIARRNFYEKIKKYNIDPNRIKEKT